MQAEPLGPEQGARACAVACLCPLGLHMLRRHRWVPPAQETPAAVPQGQCPDTQCTPKRSAGLALGQSPAVTSKISKREDFFPGGLAVKTVLPTQGAPLRSWSGDEDPTGFMGQPKKGKINTFLKFKKEDLQGAFVLSVD